MTNSTHPISWLAPQPLWRQPGQTAFADAASMPAPAILRFTTDDFMQEFQNVLATDPQRIGEYRVVPETWRGVLQQKSAPQTPKDVFALPFQRLASTRARVNGKASPLIGQQSTPGSDTVGIPLKLYQPAHLRYYLVTSSLVCQIPGLPDRTVNAGNQEVAGFVMRRLLSDDPNADPPTTNPGAWNEYAWAAGTNGNFWSETGAYSPGPSSAQFVSGEEILPFFGVNYLQDDQRQRRMFAGLVPVGKREAYLAAGNADSGASTGTDVTALKVLLRSQVIEPWKQLLDRAVKAASALTKQNSGGTIDTTNTAVQAGLASARAMLQEAAYFILVDFANFVQTYLPAVWGPLIGSAGATEPTDPTQIAALNALRNIGLSPLTPNPPGGPLGVSWQVAASPPQTVLGSLVDVFKALADGTVAKNLDAVKTSYAPSTSTAPPGYPSFVFPLADPMDDPSNPTNIHAAFPRGLVVATPLSTEESDDLKDATATDDNEMPSTAQTLDQLAVVLTRALSSSAVSAPRPAVPLAAKIPANALTGWFVIRCVYRRPACGPLHQDVVSAPTDPFQLAGFFDPDAPARPIRIGLPLDTSPAGLRKFDKNTAFVLSDMLCGHVKRARGMTFGDLVLSVLPFPFHQDLSGDNAPCQANGVSLGTICSLSIPIITICAFILLIIMVTLFDIIFSWLPFFMICFPVKGLDAKKS